MCILIHQLWGESDNGRRPQENVGGQSGDDQGGNRSWAPEKKCQAIVSQKVGEISVFQAAPLRLQCAGIPVTGELVKIQILILLGLREPHHLYFH